jgi:chromosome partitioning protein
MIDGRTVGDIQPESRSAQEVSQLWLFLRGRLAKLYGGTDPRWTEKPRADFSTAVLTPETPLFPAAALSDDEDDGWDADVPAWASIAAANVVAASPAADRRKGGQPRGPAPQPNRAATDVLTLARPEPSALDRRRSDRGPPPGQPDRRQPRSFGRRPTH